jgi:hypothetical protein
MTSLWTLTSLYLEFGYVFKVKTITQKFSILHYTTYWITINNLEWNSIWTIEVSTILIDWLVYIFRFQKSIVKCEWIFILKNYIGVFIIKFLILKPNANWQNWQKIITHYRCPRKGYHEKMDTMTPKVDPPYVHSHFLFLVELDNMPITHKLKFQKEKVPYLF